MMTIGKLNVYKRFKGDFEMFLEYMDKLNDDDLLNAIEERNIGDNDFNYIQDSLWAIQMFKNNLIAESYKQEIINGMKSYMDEDTFAMLWSMSEAK